MRGAWRTTLLTLLALAGVIAAAGVVAASSAAAAVSVASEDGLAVAGAAAAAIAASSGRRSSRSARCALPRARGRRRAARRARRRRSGACRGHEQAELEQPAEARHAPRAKASGSSEPIVRGAACSTAPVGRTPSRAPSACAVGTSSAMRVPRPLAKRSVSSRPPSRPARSGRSGRRDGRAPARAARRAGRPGVRAQLLSRSCAATRRRICGPAGRRPPWRRLGQEPVRAAERRRSRTAPQPTSPMPCSRTRQPASSRGPVITRSRPGARPQPAA